MSGDQTVAPDGDLHWWSATEISHAVRCGIVSVTEVAEALIDRIEAVNPVINALVSWDPDQVRRDAAALDRSRSRGEPMGLLHGVPYTVKELTEVAGVQHTGAMPAGRLNVGTKTAPVVSRMQRAGGLFLGKTNAPPMGYCGITTNKIFGPTLNPWDTNLSAGGSSGGAGAAVAAGLGPVAEGTDGGGSIRVPAAFNGVVGLKPSLGRIPQLITPQRFLSNVCHGPLTRTVEDTALMLDVMSGHYPADPLSLPDHGTTFSSGLDTDLTGWRIAYSPDLGFGDVDDEVGRIVERAVMMLADAGADVVYATPAWGSPDKLMWEGVWVPGMAAAREYFDPRAMRGQIDDELIELLLSADDLSVMDVVRAEIKRGEFYDAFAEFMNEFRILASPTTTVASYPVDRFNPGHLDGRPLKERLMGWSLTHPFNVTSSPAISVPAGMTADGRPVGLQIAGRPHADADVLRVAAAMERQAPWRHRRPPLNSATRAQPCTSAEEVS